MKFNMEKLTGGQDILYLLNYLQNWARLEELPMMQLLENFPAF
jgi:hypothetical protein